MGKTRFVTFYSYKGGVGRTLALANVAWKAAQQGERVVIIDFDLEAPGIRTILPFRDSVETLLNDKNLKGGFFDAVLYFQQHRLIPPLRELYATDPPIPVPGFGGKDGEIFIVPAGREDASYKRKLQEFNWSFFFEKEQGWEFFHNLRQAVEFQFEEPDWVLIDSRTGLTDIGGICTMLLPDKVVLMTGLNEQNLKGCKSVMDDIHGYSRKRKGSLAPIEIVLVASHVPETEDLDKRSERLEKAKKLFGQKIDLTLPYVPILSLEERVLVQDQGLNREYPHLMVKNYAELYWLISQHSVYDDMVKVPAGPFLAGSREDDRTARDNEKPQRPIDLPDFFMDVHPIRNYG
ncbi:MAG: SUMF1/EgtB/PvdO family nonheme iron enzyme [Pseudomonadota bacterium]